MISRNKDKKTCFMLFKYIMITLDNVSFSIQEGKVTGFLGVNGAGKTTVLKIIMGLIRPTQGIVTFSHQLGHNQTKRLSHIGYLPERPYLYPHLTGQEFAEFMASLNDIRGKKAKDKINFWSKRFNI